MGEKKRIELMLIDNSKVNVQFQKMRQNDIIDIY